MHMHTDVEGFPLYSVLCRLVIYHDPCRFGESRLSWHIKLQDQPSCNLNRRPKKFQASEMSGFQCLVTKVLVVYTSLKQKIATGSLKDGLSQTLRTTPTAAIVSAAGGAFVSNLKITMWELNWCLQNSYHDLVEVAPKNCITQHAAFKMLIY